MADERNFRSHYYEKVGFRGVEEKKSIEILLKEQPLDLKKLKQFCLRFPLPVVYRIFVWKVLLGVLPPYQNTHEYVWRHRTDQFHDIHHALTVMKKINSTSPLAEVFVKMWHVEQGTMIFDEKQMMGTFSSSIFMAIANSILELVEDEVEAYWLTKTFFKHQEMFKPQMHLLSHKTEIFLQKEEPELKLYNHLSKLDVFTTLPLQEWFSSCFAVVLPQTSFERVWDKIVGGSCKIMVFVAVAILLTFKRPLLSMKNAGDINLYLKKIPDDSADIIVGKAFDMWQKYGSLTEPSVSRGESPVIIERPPS